MLSHMVNAQVGESGPPSADPVVLADTAHVVTALTSELARFLEDVGLGREPEGKLEVGTLWGLWCESNGDHADARSSGGVSKAGRTSFTARIRAIRPEMGTPTGVWAGGKTRRAWPGWAIGVGMEAAK